MITEDDAAEYRQEAYWQRNAHRCQCGQPDWPGRCPGPANCPCVGGDADEDDADEGEDDAV